MAQAHREEKPQEMHMKDTTFTTSSSGSFKFNAQAPEFVPQTHAQVPVSGYFYPYYHLLDGSTGGPDWFYVGDQDPISFLSSSTATPSYGSKNVLTDDLRRKIIKQVEYQLSDISLLANESLSKQMNKDPEGYVPISVIASTKKIRSLISNHDLLAQALRSSSTLARTVVVENLPEDHSHHNLEKIFGVVGRVKTVRICHPHESNSSRSKVDVLISNKLHALVEYETLEIAEKAVEKLNDERNWRKGLRVRLLLRCSPKSVLKGRKSDFDGIFDDDEYPESPEDAYQPHSSEVFGENTGEETSPGMKKGFGRGRGKSSKPQRLQSHSHNGRGLLASPLPSSCSIQYEVSSKQATKGPRMPDGTRGFTMGRGKPLRTSVLGVSISE
ncbi:hypothetical protein RHMOL_Rhmol11G0248000 [Rhododendron molle]|uniref:Uncharacterized protein n=2 Tax=Rhododendron molle TaxID=49168 RepID=A0ACC0LX74_RHOML|nr:hypothetical protein RHMOL_Rhmol11G0248000 [Rhododendron molle]KAI8532866.1 hypothetical protein RHMOL_Rhmol11G0248000 [Rhododendron molle]